MKYLLILLFITSFNSKAEYRVFQYYVKSKHVFIQDNPAYLATSTLDPISYVSYHGGATNIEVDLVRTWICPGYTGLRKEYCESPYKKQLQITQRIDEN